MKFKCTSCQHVFEHESSQKECFCPKCGKASTCCTEEELPAVCSECGTKIPAGSSSCPNCGCPLSATKKQHCHECGAELTDSVGVCPKCGCPLAPTTPTYVSPIPPVSITQTACPIDLDDQELSLPPRSKALYWYIGGLIAVLLIGFGVFYYATDSFKDMVNTEETVTDASRQVVIDGVNLRLRYEPSTKAKALKWPDGTNRCPQKGERFPYTGETEDFYRIDFNGVGLYVSKQHSHIE